VVEEVLRTRRARGAVRATAERGKPHEQAVAFYVLGQAKDRAAIPILQAQSEHPYPLVRGYAERALDAIK
jgi:hypothetical protein